ncbi:unnamed protein product [Cuscuta europaea]|uniref:NAC domain-containing protein n=1 Tax=Cuscuta europaea TaxID=41803 RepID=A0A9P1E1B0_CUSEU|nr:unnamed protein product [Cuscuta europaea]
MMEDGDISGEKEMEDVELGASNNSEQEIRNSDSNNGKAEICLATASSMFPGFRFSPTDQELISYYLKKKLEGIDSCVELISEVEIWRHEPWDLPGTLPFLPFSFLSKKSRFNFQYTFYSICEVQINKLLV